MSLVFILPASNMIAFVPDAKGSMNAYEQVTVTGNINDNGFMFIFIDCD